MIKEISGNYLRTHRLKSGLTQRELGQFLGYRDEGPVSRHEISKTVPPLKAALAYETIFRVPVAEIFPELHAEIMQRTEGQLVTFKEDLQKRSGRGRGANETAQKLIWLSQRSELS
jgi:DNA-binding XRE family transcriptional regulator